MTDIIFDVDGTLMNVEKRSSLAKKNKKDSDKIMDWDIFLDPKIMLEYDTPNIDVCNIAMSLRGNHDFDKHISWSIPSESPFNRIIITSARNEKHRKVTESQLKNAGLQPFDVKSSRRIKIYSDMYLRDDGDFRPDDIVKEELLGKIRADGYNPTIAFDDRNQVVKKWRELGIHCYQVREGNF